MNRTTALALVGIVLVLVVLTVGEDGVVSQIASNPPTNRAEQAAEAESSSPTSVWDTAGRQASQISPEPPRARDGVPIYRYGEEATPAQSATYRQQRDDVTRIE